jgi:hypothetical protein
MNFINLSENNNRSLIELIENGNLKLQLGANACFYVNKLNHVQFDDLVETIPDKSIKAKLNNKLQSGKQVNWISTSVLSNTGLAPCEELKDAFEIYKGFELDDQSKKVGLYGEVSLSVNFSKLDLVKDGPEGEPAYPFGILFFSDSFSSYDKYNAVISTLDVRRHDASSCHYVNPVSYAMKSNVVCSGKFRYSGSFIIFYVTNEIEKQAGMFYPEITIVSIPVATIRKRDESKTIERTGITGVHKRNNCTSDLIFYLKGIFDYYHVEDHQYIGEVIHAMGYDPIEYGYPPSLGDSRSSYYGGNHIHLGGSRGNGARYERPENKFARGSGIFSYLEEINQKNIIKTSIIHTQSERPNPPSLPIEEEEEEEAVSDGYSEGEYSSYEVEEALDSVSSDETASEDVYEEQPEEQTEEQTEEQAVEEDPGNANVGYEDQPVEEGTEEVQEGEL